MKTRNINQDLKLLNRALSLVYEPDDIELDDWRDMLNEMRKMQSYYSTRLWEDCGRLYYNVKFSIKDVDFSCNMVYARLHCSMQYLKDKINEYVLNK